MINSKLKIYFKTNLDKPSIHFKWTNEDNENLFNYLDANFTDTQLQETKTQLEIKQSFREYFEPIGYILITLKDKKIKLKVFPYKIQAKDSRNIDAIMDILEENEDLIEENYNQKEDLVSLNAKLKNKIFNFLEADNEEINNKELVKYVIREYFELEARDIVIVKSNQIIIKLLDDQSIHEVAEEDVNTIANRYNGINEDDLKSFYDDIFSKDEHEDFFYFVAEEFVQVNMINKIMDNRTYEHMVFPSIQAIITEKLINSFDYNEEFFKGFSGYVFRLHFKEVFSYISDLILTKLSDSNDYISNFLKYYTMSVVILNGKRYKVPEIEASDGWKWNVSSMTPVIKVYIKAENTLLKLENELSSLEERISNLYVAKTSPVIYNNTLNKEIDSLRQEVTFSAKRLNTYVSTLKDDTSNMKLKKEIHEIRKDLADFNSEIDLLSSKVIAKDIVLKYTDLKRNIDSKTRQKEREEKVIKTNQSSFDSISEALVKALTSKKVLIS